MKGGRAKEKCFVQNSRLFFFYFYKIQVSKSMHINCSEYNLHALNSSFITDIIYGKMALLRVPIPYMYIASSSSFFPLNWCISVKISTHFAILLRIARQIYCAWSASKKPTRLPSVKRVDFGGTGGGGRAREGWRRKSLRNCVSFALCSELIHQQ